jgi:hypothetical protein
MQASKINEKNNASVLGELDGTLKKISVYCHEILMVKLL